MLQAEITIYTITIIIVGFIGFLALLPKSLRGAFRGKEKYEDNKSFQMKYKYLKMTGTILFDLIIVLGIEIIMIKSLYQNIEEKEIYIILTISFLAAGGVFAIFSIPYEKEIKKIKEKMQDEKNE